MNRRHTIPKELRYTVEDFHKRFPDDDACLEQIKEQRFPQGITHCRKCLKSRKHYRVKGRTAYACETCGNHIFPLAGTIFEKTSTSLRLWFYAMYLMGSTHCGISAKRIQRETGVTYKTAWRMFHQIRKLMSEDLRLGGAGVEMDEMYHGGRRKGGSGRLLGGNRRAEGPHHGPSQPGIDHLRNECAGQRIRAAGDRDLHGRCVRLQCAS